MDTNDKDEKIPFSRLDAEIILSMLRGVIDLLVPSRERGVKQANEFIAGAISIIRRNGV